MNYRSLAGVTSWPLFTTGGVAQTSVLTTILSGFGNYVGTGAEGGLATTALIRNGTTADGNQMNYWYANDWTAIQGDLQLANAVINGSNSNPPLAYNQFGINQLLSVLQRLGISGTSFGLYLSASFTATPFNTYIAANPTNYAAGIYGGFVGQVTPQLGFTTITFYVSATNFA